MKYHKTDHRPCKLNQQHLNKKHKLKCNPKGPWAKNKPKNYEKITKLFMTPFRKRFMDSKMGQSHLDIYHNVLLMPSFDLTGRGSKTEPRKQSYGHFREAPLITQSWVSRNTRTRSSVLGSVL